MTTSDTASALWAATWVAGPDAGRTVPLAPGRHFIGRSPRAAVRADDPGLEPHHAQLTIGPDQLELTQLAGGTRLTVDGAVVSGTARITSGAWVEIGGSLLRLGPGPVPAAERPATVHGHDLVRAPRLLPAPVAAVHASPDDGRVDVVEAPGVAALMPTLFGAAGAGALALLMHQPLFFVFGLLGASVGVASWVTQRVAAARRRRRTAAAHTRDLADLAAAQRVHREATRRAHEASAATLVSAVTAIESRTQRLWSRRATETDAFVVSLGLGDVTTDDGDTLSAVAVPVTLGPATRLAVAGCQAAALTRSLVVQVAAHWGPADVRIVVITDNPAEWSWLQGLPHCTLPDGTTAVVGETALATTLTDLAAHHGHLVLITDKLGALTTRTSPLRRAIADPTQHALIAVLTGDTDVPHVCTSAVHTRAVTARWEPSSASEATTVVRTAGLGVAGALACVRALTDLTDPEDPLAATASVPRDVSLTELLGGLPSAHEIARTWATEGNDPSPRALIGVAADGLVDIDLVRDGPHGLIAGTTGAGKSELLRTLVVGMAANSSPDHLALVLVDYKGGATFDACATLPHVVGVITDLDEHLADRALRSLHAELRRREAVLREHGASDLGALAARGGNSLPRLVVVVDEFAALAAEQPEFLHALVGVAQRGRSLGVHLLLATQRPSGVVSDDVRANTNLRLALRLHDAADALDVVGVTTPATLPRQLAGRGVLRLGPDEHLVFHAARCTAREPGRLSALDVLAHAIRQAAEIGDYAPPASPWQPPLPEVLTRPLADAASAWPGDALGIIDDPDHQRLLPLQWHPRDGHLLAVGSPGSGVSSTLATLAARAIDSGAHVHVIDCRGGETFAPFVHHQQVGAVVAGRDRERIARVLRQCTRPRERDDATQVLVVEGLEVLRRLLDDSGPVEDGDRLAELLTGATDTVVLAGAEHLAALPSAFLAACTTRWVHHLHDPHDAGAIGLRPAQVPPRVAGRVCIAASGLMAQLVAPGAPLPAGDGTFAVKVRTVPSVILAADLPDGDDRSLRLGVDIDTGCAATLCPADGDHLLVLGPPRSGRTSALAQLVAEWRRLHPHAEVLTISGGELPPCPPDELPAGAVLLVADDAETIDDPEGRLAAWLVRPGITMFAATLPDAVRGAYGHWTQMVRRRRIGLVAASGSDLDGDLLGATLPRSLPVAARPGLMWVVECGRARLVQVALPGATAQAGLAASRLATR